MLLSFSGDGDVTKDQLRLNTEASYEEMTSQNSYVVEISSDEETEYIEQDISEVVKAVKVEEINSSSMKEESVDDSDENVPLEKRKNLNNDSDIPFAKKEKTDADVTKEQLRLYTEASDEEMSSQKSNVIEISIDEETKYNFVFIEIETILASNSHRKEITQIGGFKENTIGNSDAQFFKAIVSNKLDYYLENYKLGGDLLQTLHMQKNDCGSFEFRNQFLIPEDDRQVIQCVNESEAFQDLSSYLAFVENCILVSLNEENIQLLANKMKLLGITNRRIHIDSVKGFCTWSSYLKEVGGSKEELNQEFEDWYDSYVKNSSSSEYLQKHADIVAKMVRDSVHSTMVRSNRGVFRQLVKASRPINSLLFNQMSEEEYQDSEIQYLELFNSLRPDFPVTIPLKKLETYDIFSEDEEPRNDEDDELVRLARIGTLAQVEAELAKLPVEDKFTRAAKLNYACQWRWDHDKSLDRIGGTAIIAAVRRGKVNMVVALLKAGADPTLEAKTSDDVTEDAVMAAQFKIKNAEVAVQEAITNHAAKESFKMKSVLLRLEQAKFTLELLLIANKYWTKAPYAGVKYFEERLRAFARNPNKPTDLVQLKQELEAFMKMNETKFNIFAKEDKELHELHELKQKRVEDYKKQNLKKQKCPMCNEKFGTTVERNSHIITKHYPNNFDQLPVRKCQKCNLWFTNANINKKKLKYHMKECNPSTNAKVISPEPTLNVPTKVTTPPKPISNNSSKDKPLHSIISQDTISKTASIILSNDITVETIPTKDSTPVKSVLGNEASTKDQINNGPRPYQSTLPYYVGYEKDSELAQLTRTGTLA